MTAKEIFEALASPFPESQVRTRPSGRMGKMLHYITARTARNRLNEVLGPWNWTCKVWPAEKWVKCTITITVPDADGDGSIEVTREAIGGYPDMPNEEDRVKGGDSDAFKRACALFGIGEYLYGEDESHDVLRNTEHGGTAPVSSNVHPPTKQQVAGWYDKQKDTRTYASPPQQQDRGWPRNGRQLFAWLKGIEKDYRWPSVIAEVNENFGQGSNYGFHGKITDWNEEQADAVATFAAHECAKMDSYGGEFDSKMRTN